jgi:hypothetical protein
LEWFLCGRDADCGISSNFGAVVAAIEGFRGVMSSGDKFTSAMVEWADATTAFARDRVIRPRWNALDGYSQDLLTAHYLGKAKVGDYKNGFAKFPRGFESYLDHPGVAWFLARLDGTLAALLVACESGKAGKLEPFNVAAEAALREAHRAYYLIANSLEEAASYGLEGAYFEHMSDFSDKPLSQNDGVWRQL